MRFILAKSLSFVSLLLALTVAHSAETNSTQPKLTNPYASPTLVEKNMDMETNSSDAANWNIADFKNHFKNNGMDESIIGNANTLMMQGTAGNLSASQNPNLMTSESLQSNKDLNNSDWLSGWNNSLKDVIVTNSIQNSNVSLLQIDNTKINCFLTRDISFQWQCTKSGVIYGGEMTSNGRVARLKCEHECYEQETCVSVQDSFNSTNTYKQADVSWQGTINKDNNVSFTINSTQTRILTSLNVELPKQYKNVGLSIQYTQNGKTIYAIKDLNLETYDSNGTIPINAQVSNLKFILKALKKDMNSTDVIVSGVSLNYVSDRKFICPALQDVKDLVQDSLGNKCLNGSITTFTMANGKTYELCSTSSLKGNNQDGTFSNESSCNAVCKTSYGCTPNYTTMTTDTLEQFREACMVNDENKMCSDTTDDCKVARLTKAPILNEVVFNATAKSTNTIVDGVQIQGVTRPRVEPNDILNYERRKQEEWKDGAFKNMAQYSKYNKTTSTVGSESVAENAYRMSIGLGSNVGLPGTSNVATRGLLWLLKPNSLDVNTGTTKYFYAIIKARLGYMDYDVYGQKQKKFKDIWYLKTSKDNDDLLAIKYGKDIGYIGSTDGNFSFIANQYATIQDLTFNQTSKTWVPFNPAQTAQYFMSNKLDANTTGGYPYWEIPIINNSGLIVKQLDGLVTSRDPLPARTEHYDTNMDGTGDGMLYYEVLVYYSTSPKTFSELYSLIDSGAMKTIYKSTEAHLFPTSINGDGSSSNKDIKIFKYGPATNTSVYTQIYPKEKDVGKKGFIFIFVQ